MAETREQLFARLEALGFEKVGEMRNRGILDGEPAWVYEWLEERGIKRLDEANSLQREAVYAAERSAAGAEKSARYAMVAALVALATVLVSIIPGCIERLRAQGMGYPPGGYGIRQDVPNVGSLIPDRIVSGSSIPVDKTWPELTPEERKRWKERNYEAMSDSDEPPFPLHGLAPVYGSLERLMQRLKEEGRIDLAVEGPLELELAVDPQGNVRSVKVWKSPHPELTKSFAGSMMFEKFKPALCGGTACSMPFPLRASIEHRIR